MERLIKALVRGMRPEAFDLKTGDNLQQFEAYRLADDTMNDLMEQHWFGDVLSDLHHEWNEAMYGTDDDDWEWQS